MRAYVPTIYTLSFFGPAVTAYQVLKLYMIHRNVIVTNCITYNLSLLLHRFIDESIRVIQFHCRSITRAGTVKGSGWCGWTRTQSRATYHYMKFKFLTITIVKLP